MTSPNVLLRSRNHGRHFDCVLAVHMRNITRRPMLSWRAGEYSLHNDTASQLGTFQIRQPFVLVVVRHEIGQNIAGEPSYIDTFRRIVSFQAREVDLRLAPNCENEIHVLLYDAPELDQRFLPDVDSTADPAYSTVLSDEGYPIGSILPDISHQLQDFRFMGCSIIVSTDNRGLPNLEHDYLTPAPKWQERSESRTMALSPVPAELPPRRTRGIFRRISRLGNRRPRDR